jgi:hypothetical protein
MKTKSETPRRSTQNYLRLNNHIVYQDGNQWRSKTATLFGKVLVDADCFSGPLKGQFVNLITARTPLSRQLRTSIDMNLVS